MKRVKDNPSSIESNQKKKVERKLMKKNSKLKAHASRLKAIIEEFKSIQLQMSKMAFVHNNENTKFYIPDIQMQLCHKLHQFAGSQCQEFDKNLRFVFEINTEQNVKKNDLYAIEILIDENGRGKLGKWALPSINVQKILSQHPIGDKSSIFKNNIKSFLKSCKHHVDSFLCRFKQLDKLQDLLCGILNVEISKNSDLTEIKLHLPRIKDIDTEILYDVILNLFYEPTGVRPCKLLWNTKPNGQLPGLVIKLKDYFKPFLKKDLSSAFSEISQSQTIFVFSKIIADDNKDISEISKESDESFEQLSKEFLYQCNMECQTESEVKQGSTRKDDSSEKEEGIQSRKRKRLIKIKSHGTKGDTKRSKNL
ncbi:uncharacterized protein [Anoplolepis gracilipes]|uniref:uncharacterized protein n=1 Tax=Anoplolepis gracilipes TaxID=354296 RepID=UPI003B9E70F4